jgi:hypothetical protein
VTGHDGGAHARRARFRRDHKGVLAGFSPSPRAGQRGADHGRWHEGLARLGFTLMRRKTAAHPSVLSLECAHALGHVRRRSAADLRQGGTRVARCHRRGACRHPAAGYGSASRSRAVRHLHRAPGALGVPCLTHRDNTERAVTVEDLARSRRGSRQIPLWDERAGEARSRGDPEAGRAQ